jgi:ssDNA thymidine ADP-ribosyltransferase, DarT
MLLNIKTGHSGMKQTPMPEIAILVSSIHTLIEQSVPFVFTDRHAYLRTADDAFSRDLAEPPPHRLEDLAGA